MNKILKQNLLLTNNNKLYFLNKIIFKKIADFSSNKAFNFNKCSKRGFSVDYAELEKKLDKFYENHHKDRVEYLKTILTDKEKKDVEVILRHIDNLDETEKDYFKVKLESEMKKQLDSDIFQSSYTLSNLDMFKQIEIDGVKYGFGQNLVKNIAPFYGTGIAAAAPSNIHISLLLITFFLSQNKFFFGVYNIFKSFLFVTFLFLNDQVYHILPYS